MKKWYDKKVFELDDWWQDYLIKNRHAEIWIKKPLPDDWVPNPVKAFRTPETQAKAERIYKKKMDKLELEIRTNEAWNKANI